MKVPTEQQHALVVEQMRGLVSMARVNETSALQFAHLVRLLGGADIPDWALRACVEGIEKGTGKRLAQSSPMVQKRIDNHLTPDAAAGIRAPQESLSTQTLVRNAFGDTPTPSQVLRWLHALTPVEPDRAYVDPYAKGRMALINALVARYLETHPGEVQALLQDPACDKAQAQVIVWACLDLADQDRNAQLFHDTLVALVATALSRHEWPENLICRCIVDLARKSYVSPQARTEGLHAIHADFLMWTRREIAQGRPAPPSLRYWAEYMHHNALRLDAGRRQALLDKTWAFLVGTADRADPQRTIGLTSSRGELDSTCMFNLMELARGLAGDAHPTLSPAHMADQIAEASQELAPTFLLDIWRALGSWDTLYPGKLMRVLGSLTAAQVAAAIRGLDLGMRIFRSDRTRAGLELPPSCNPLSLYQQLLPSFRGEVLPLRPSQLAAMAFALELQQIHFDAPPFAEHLGAILDVAPKVRTPQLLALLMGLVAAHAVCVEGNDAAERITSIESALAPLRSDRAVFERNVQLHDADGTPVYLTFEHAIRLALQPTRLLTNDASDDGTGWNWDESLEILRLDCRISHDMTLNTAIVRAVTMPDCSAHTRNQLVLSLLRNSSNKELMSLATDGIRHCHAALLALVDTSDLPANPSKAGEFPQAVGLDAPAPARVTVVGLMEFYELLWDWCNDPARRIRTTADEPRAAPIQFNEAVTLMQAMRTDLTARMATQAPAIFRTLDSKLCDFRDTLLAPAAPVGRKAGTQADSLDSPRKSATSMASPAPSSIVAGPDSKHTPSEAPGSTALRAIEQLPDNAKAAAAALKRVQPHLVALCATLEGRQALLESLTKTASRRAVPLLVLEIQVIAPALAAAQDPSTAALQLYHAMADPQSDPDVAAIVVREVASDLHKLAGGNRVINRLRTLINASTVSAARSQILRAALDEIR